MSYLERWWRDASDVKKETFTNLVHNGQLEIVGGGWVMNDEVILVLIIEILNAILPFSVDICAFLTAIAYAYNTFKFHVFLGQPISLLRFFKLPNLTGFFLYFSAG